MKILVLGSEGMLGSAVVSFLKEDHHVLCRSHKDYDLRGVPKFFRDDLKKFSPSVVINCAAYTYVDASEDNKSLAMEMNAIVPGKLAEECNKKDITLVHISTDYVFDGQKKSPYREEDEVNPINFYGESKMLGEEQVQRHTDNYLILRTSWLYGPNGRSFVRSLLDKYKSGEREFRIVNDQKGKLTHTRALAEAISRCLQKDMIGLYHCANAGEVTWYGIAKDMFRILNIEDIRVVPITTEELGAKANRPRYSVLDTCKLENEGGFSLSCYLYSLTRFLVDGS